MSSLNLLPEREALASLRFLILIQVSNLIFPGSSGAEKMRRVSLLRPMTLGRGDCTCDVCF